ncbi:hypothetical protein ACVXG7_07230 [Enterobacter hormaechei]
MLRFTQQQLAQVGVKPGSRRWMPDSERRKWKAKDRKRAAYGCSTPAGRASTGEADWSLSPLFASQNWPPTLFNTAFYSNPQVDKDLADALKPPQTGREKARLYKRRRTLSGKSRRGCRWWWKNWSQPTTKR